MCTKVQLFLFDCYLYWNLINDVLLGPILNSNEPKPKSDILSLNHPLGTGSSVHNINLGYDSYGPNSLWIAFSSHLETV